MKLFDRADEIRCGVVGYGASFHMGRHHLNAMAAAGMQPVAVADIDPTRLPVAQAEFPGIKTYLSTTEMLADCDLDLVGVITPHNAHACVALECLEAGKHVVTEKPFAITIEECDAMIAAADAHGVMLSVHHNRHWDGCILKAVDNIRSGMIGEIVRIEAHMGGYRPPRDWWRASKSISGGINYDWGAHFLEYALQLIDSETVEVAGFARTGYWAPRSPWGDDAIEDEALTVVRFANGVPLTLLISQLESNPRDGWFDITGTQGSYRFDHQRWQAMIHEGGGRVYREGPNPPSESWRFYRNVAAHLVEGEPLIITPEWARRTIEIIDLADRSAKQGQTLHV